MKKILCYSGGKDSTAMLIYLIEHNYPIDEVLYVDMGDWMWECAKTHLQLVEDKFNIKITKLDVSKEVEKGFKKWGFPSFVNRWCTGIKREAMKKYLKNKYGCQHLVQYIGYCADESKRTSKKLYHSYDVEYPLVDAGITTEDALKICGNYGFDFGGIYTHHSHFNCWLCPLQRKSELEYIYIYKPLLWNKLCLMQQQMDGYFYSKKSVFQLSEEFWNKTKEDLKQQRLNLRSR